MPHLFRTRDGVVHTPGGRITLRLPDGTAVEGIWGGSAQVEKLGWWLKKSGHDLAETAEVSEIAIRDEDTEEMRWGTAPPDARLLFVVQPSPPGKNYRIAKMVTTAAAPDQEAYFNETRFSLFAVLERDGGIRRITPLPAPPPTRSQQGDLFD